MTNQTFASVMVADERDAHDAALVELDHYNARRLQRQLFLVSLHLRKLYHWAATRREQRVVDGTRCLTCRLAREEAAFWKALAVLDAAVYWPSATHRCCQTQ